jgi:hypothetical protein
VELEAEVDGKIRAKVSGRRMISSERGGGTVLISEGGYRQILELLCHHITTRLLISDQVPENPGWSAPLAFVKCNGAGVTIVMV